MMSLNLLVPLGGERKETFEAVMRERLIGYEMNENLKFLDTVVP